MSINSELAAEIKHRAVELNGILRAAFERKYRDGGPYHLPEQALEFHRAHSPVFQWDVAAFFDAYVARRPDISERTIGRTMALLLEVKLQLYYVLEVDLGLYNRLLADIGEPGTIDNLNEFPDKVMIRQSLDQNLIGKSRVLWERLMNFAFYVATCAELKEKHGSKRQPFFVFVKEHADWSFLAPYEGIIDWYERQFRTPEYHGGSVLRKELIGGPPVNAQSLLIIINGVLPHFWENLLSVLRGAGIVSTIEFRFNEDGGPPYPNTTRLTSQTA